MGKRSKRKKQQPLEIKDQEDSSTQAADAPPAPDSDASSEQSSTSKLQDIVLTITGMIFAWCLAVSIRSDYTENTTVLPAIDRERIESLNSTLTDHKKIEAYVESIRTSDARNDSDQQILAIYSQWESNRANRQWQGRLLPTTHDSYLYSAIIHQVHESSDPSAIIKDRPPPMNHGAITSLGAILVRFFGVHPADVITFLPVYTAGLLAIPVVLLGRLFGSTLMGICAACIAVVAFSYFNRTNAGYFDTDMFSVTLPALGLYFLLRAHRQESIPWLLAGAFVIFTFPFFYNSGVPIVVALGAAFVGFRALLFLWKEFPKWFAAGGVVILSAPIFFKLGLLIIPILGAGIIGARIIIFLVATRLNSESDHTFLIVSTAVLSTAIAGCSLTTGARIENAPGFTILAFLALALISAFCWAGHRISTKPVFRQVILALAGIGLIWMLGFSDSFTRIRSATVSYLPNIQNKADAQHREQQASNTLVFKNVKETIVEAKKSPWSELMMRISGSSWGCILALLGYGLLVLLRPELIIALPFVGIGVFAHWGGHRFTIHAVPIAALGAAFLPLAMVEAGRRISNWMNIPVPSKIEWPQKPLAFARKHPSWFFAINGALLASVVLTFFMWKENRAIARDRSYFLNPVLKQDEVQLLDELKQASRPGDYVHSWWDWGTAIWTHSERNVLTTPANQSADTFIMAKMMMTDSPKLAAHLGNTTSEMFHQQGGTAVGQLFAKATAERTPASTLADLEEHVPVKLNRDSYLYLPYRLMQFYNVLEQFSERDLLTGELHPKAQWHLCGGFKTDGQEQVILMHPMNPATPIFHVHLKTLAMADLARSINAHQLHRSLQQGQNPLANNRFVAFHLKDGRIVYGDSKIQTEGDDFVFRPLAIEKVEPLAKLPMTAIQTVYPGTRIKQVIFDTTKRQTVGKDFEDPNLLSLVVQQNPPVALLADDRAFASQMMQLLVLGNPDPKYFVEVASNSGGRVYRIKRPVPEGP